MNPTGHKAVKLFEFLQEITKLKLNDCVNIDGQNRVIYLESVPNSPHVQEYVKTYNHDDEHILGIKKTTIENPPQPPQSIADWLKAGWKDFHIELGHEDSIYRKVDINGKEETREEFFDQNEKRVLEYNKYKITRAEWAEKQKLLDRVLKIFTELYNARNDLKREPDQLEMLVADGFVISRDKIINHPILTKKVSLTFDAEKNWIYIDNTDNIPQIYSELILKIAKTLSKNQDNGDGQYNAAAAKELEEELAREEYHPLDTSNVMSFIKRFAHSISNKCHFLDIRPADREDLPIQNELYMYSRPVFFIRKKPDGTSKAVQSIINALNTGVECPAHILDIIAPQPSPVSKEGEECEIPENDDWSKVSGESLEILLAKPANEEQLKIAKEVMRNNAVLVQGPPGTGKTHTIANLLGHFLAQGKNVLVTSHTTKALEVLKDKLPENVQSLCASMIEDNNKDFAISVTKIAENLDEDPCTFKYKSQLIREERKDIIDALSKTRKNILDIKFSEWKTVCINGENISPSELALRVQEGRDKYENVVPGSIDSSFLSFPLTNDELSELYRTNTSLDENIESLLSHPLADIGLLPAPDEFKDFIRKHKNTWNDLENSYPNSEINFSENCLSITINPNIKLKVDLSDKQKFCDKKKKIDESLSMIDGNWYKNAVIAGMMGKPFVEDWHTLKKAIESAYLFFCDNKQSIDKVEIKHADSNSMFSLQKVKETLDGTFFSSIKRIFFGSHIDAVSNAFSINGKAPSSLDDCRAIEVAYEMQQKRDSFLRSWTKLMGKDTLSELNKDCPEFDAYSWIDYIDRALTWHDNFSKTLRDFPDIGTSSIISLLKIDKRTKKKDIIDIYLKKLPDLMSKIGFLYEKLDDLVCYQNQMKKVMDHLRSSESAQTEISKSLLRSYSDFDLNKYKESYDYLSLLHSKQADKELRASLLERLKKAAPDMAKRIEQRVDGYNKNIPPDNIADAWNWKVQDSILKELNKDSLEELSDKASDLAEKLRKRTEEQVEYQSWYHLLTKLNERDDSKNIKSALKRLLLTIKKLGKGKGKNAASHRASAREDMSICQTAVPAWVMPISRAMETFDAGKTKFDIVIIDEASQANLSALALAFMAKKLIIVGDDKQVSPLAIGIEKDNVSQLVDRFLKDEISGYNLYGAETSIYDLASVAAFPRIMLKEHFRCVPDIIGYSNTYYYDSEIRPLRSSSSTIIKPSLVSYAVKGTRVGRSPNVTNEAEAMAICALIRSCLDQPEYCEKTFGVISLLGECQCKLIQDKLSKYISPVDIEERNIVCGIAAHFQGDERNVMFLSMVDALDNNELAERGESTSVTLRKVKNGNDIWKRYNVAVSRAKDQLWLVHSDIEHFLKPDDLRYELLQYIKDPAAFSVQQSKIEAKSDSQFEKEVATELALLNYKIEQQFEVGRYRIDIVVSCGDKRVAVECDGDRYHADAGEEKIRQDMNRQLVLERLGWRFIRIRGSHWYRDKEQALEWLIRQLAEHQIVPTGDKRQDTATQEESELENRVRKCAGRYLDEWRQQDTDSVLAADVLKHTT